MLNAFKTYKITYMIIMVNLVVYLFSAWKSQSFMDMDTKALVDMGALYGPYTVQNLEWSRLFTAMFLHASLTHLLMNMFSLYLIARSFELYFEIKSYLSIYLFSGLLGGLASLYMHLGSVSVGASGAIFGVFGALAGFFFAYRGQIEVESKAFMKNFAVIMGLNLVFGFAIESVDVSAHIGGLVVGFIGGFFISKNPKRVWRYSAFMLLLMLSIMSYLPSLYVQTQF